MSRFLAALWIRVPLVVACSIAACAGSTETGDPAGTLAWGVIPGFVCTVGVPIDRDLRAYLTDPSGVATVTLDRALPDGLDLQNGRIEGTPTTETPSRSYSAIADDGSGTVATSSAFTIRVRLPAVGDHPMLDAIRAMPANSCLELVLSFWFRNLAGFIS